MRNRHFSYLWFLPLLIPIILLLSVPNRGVAAQSDTYTLSHWEMKDGLPSDDIRYLLQDTKGYIWIATFQGLVRFDGIRFVTYKVQNTPNLPNNLINCLFEDSQKRLWLGHDTGELSVLENGRILQTAIPDSWKGTPIDRIAEAPNGTIIALNRDGHLLPVQSYQAGEIHSSTSDNKPFDLVTDNSGNLWISTNTQVYQLEVSDTTLSEGLTSPVQLTNEAHIFAGKGNNLWIATINNLIQIDTDTANIKKQVRQNIRENSWTPQWLMRRNETIVAATFTRGLFQLARDGQVSYFNSEMGLPIDWISSIAEDRQGNLWIGTGGQGLACLRSPKIESIAPADNWEDRPIKALFQDSTGTVWIGTEGASLYQYDEGQWDKVWLSNSSGSGAVIKSIIEPEPGELWIGASWTIYRYDLDGEPLEKGPMEPGLVSALLKDSKGRIWSGGLEKLSYFENDEWTEVYFEGSPITHTTSIAETNDGSVWISSLGKGLIRIDQSNQLTAFTKENAYLESNFISTLESGANGDLWIGTHDSGLSLFRNGRFHSFSIAEGLPDACISQIIEDGNHLWLGTNSGIARIETIRIDDLLAGKTDSLTPLIIHTTNVVGTSQMAINTQNTSLKTADGRLWFATRRGVAIIDPVKFGGMSEVPDIIVEEVRIDGSSTPLIQDKANASKIEVPAGSRRIEIDFTALNLADATALSFEYKDSESGDKWINIGNRRTLYLNTLKPGEHLIHLRMANLPQEDNLKTTQLVLHALPYFWQTNAFIFLLVVIILSITGTIVFVWTRFRYQRRMQRMKRKQAIKDERTRIAHDLHDDIGSGLHQLSFLTDCIEGILEDPESTKPIIKDIHDTTEEMTDSIDQIVWAVNPNYDSLESLLVYISHIAQSHAKRAGIGCRLLFPPEPQNISINPEARYEICLALREALNNSLKHSHASEIRLEFEYESNEMVLTLEDNGVGFDPHKRQADDPGRGIQGLGMLSMKKRMKKIGGHFECQSVLGKGTKITFKFSPEKATLERNP